MTFPIFHAFPLFQPSVQLDIGEEGGVSVTIPEAAPVPIAGEDEPTVTVAEADEPSVTVPAGVSIPPACIGLGEDGNVTVTIPPGLSVWLPVDRLGGLVINGVVLRIPTRTQHGSIKFPSGGKITVLRRGALGQESASSRELKVEGLGASMDPLP